MRLQVTPAEAELLQEQGVVRPGGHGLTSSLACPGGQPILVDVVIIGPSGSWSWQTPR